MTWPERHEPTCSDFDAASEARWSRQMLVAVAEHRLRDGMLRALSAKPIILPEGVDVFIMVPPESRDA